MKADKAVTKYEIAAWVAMAAALVLILTLHLLTALLGGLLIHEAVHVLSKSAIVRSLTTTRARMAAVFLISTVIITLVALIVVGIVAFLHGDSGHLPALLEKLGEVLESSRAYLPSWLFPELPSDADGLKGAASEWLAEHVSEVEKMGRGLGAILVHFTVGMIIGAMISLREAAPHEAVGPLATAMLERVQRLAMAFRRVVFAQVRIAAINALLTGLYLAVALPLAGVHLPFSKTLFIVTFLCGLIPVVGNLISNTAVVMVSLSQSIGLAFASLAFLVVIHKLEYFLNARIVGTQIRSRAWELLVAMLVMEAAFGLAGIAAAPIYYAYLKDELIDRDLI